MGALLKFVLTNSDAITSEEKKQTLSRFEKQFPDSKYTINE